MGKRDARLFQIIENQHHTSWNIVELESQQELRHTTNKMIQLCHSNTVTTSELHQQMQESLTLFGRRFSLHLARCLQEQRNTQEDRQAIVYLLTLLNDQATIPLLQHIADQHHLPRAIRLSAALALAGMNATQETAETDTHEYPLRHSS